MKGYAYFHSLRNDESLAAGGDEPGGVPSEPERDNTTVPAAAITSASGSSVTGSHSRPHSSAALTTDPSRTHSVHDTTLRSGASRPPTTAAIAGTRRQHGDAHRSSTISGSSTSSRQRGGIPSRLSSTAVIGDDLHRNSTKVGDEVYSNPTEIGGGVSELVDGEVDLNNFEDFDDNLYDEMEIEGEGRGGEIADVPPGHHEWPLDNDSQNDFQLQQEQDTVKENFSTMETNTEIIGGAGNLERTTSHSHSRVESGAPKSKLSLRQQKSAKTRVCELEHRGRGERRENPTQQTRNPPVASVKPIQQHRQQQLPRNDEEKQYGVVVASSSSMLTESELYEEPVVLKSIREVENNSWKLQPFVKIKVD